MCTNWTGGGVVGQSWKFNGPMMSIACPETSIGLVQLFGPSAVIIQIQSLVVQE